MLKISLGVCVTLSLSSAAPGAMDEPVNHVSGFGESMLLAGRSVLVWKGTPGELTAGELGCDRFYRPVESPLGDAVAVWAGSDQGEGVVVVRMDGHGFLGPWEEAGLPCWDNAGNLWFTADGELLRNGESTGQLLTAHHISVSPDGGTVVFTDRGDRLLSMEIATGAVDTLSTDYRYYAPIFTSQGDIISPSLDGGIIKYRRGETACIDQGEHPVWWREREALIYVKTTDDGHSITSSDIWMWTEEGGSERLGETPDIIEINPATSARGVLYVDLATGRAGFRGVPR